MRVFIFISVNIIILGTIYLWVGFFVSSEVAVYNLSNTILTLIVFLIFVFGILLQFFPWTNISLNNRLILAVISTFFIPLLIICFAHTYREIGIRESCVSNEISNVDYLYFSIVTFTTLGYGDLTPAKDARIYAALEAICGFLFVPLLISIFINTTKEVGDDRRRDREDYDKLRDVINRND